MTRSAAVFLIAAASLGLAAAFFPAWVLYFLTIALAKSLVALGLVILFRCGFVSFGHGLYYCLGAYVPGVLGRLLGVTDAVLAVVGGLVLAVAVGALFGTFLTRYRGVFFAMFNMALSMMLYGALLKAHSLGGSDGLSIPSPTILGVAALAGNKTLTIYLMTALLALASCFLVHRYFGSSLGLRSLGVRDNELRVDYLGASSREVVFVNYLLSAGLAGVGGALTALATGHVTPELSYWTVSGEFVFITVLSGYASVAAVPVASLFFEGVRLVAGQFLPHAWQLILGSFLLLTILFAPNGLGGLFSRWRERPAIEPQGEPAARLR